MVPAEIRLVNSNEKVTRVGLVVRTTKIWDPGNVLCRYSLLASTQWAMLPHGAGKLSWHRFKLSVPVTPQDTRMTAPARAAPSRRFMGR
jgi:hypothetical protein